MRIAVPLCALSIAACLSLACKPSPTESVVQAPASPQGDPAGPATAAKSPEAPSASAPPTPPASATADAPCLTGAQIEEVILASKDLGSHTTKGDSRYVSIKCAGGWATCLSEVVNGHADAMIIVLRFDAGAWTVVTWGSAVNDAVPASLRPILSQ
jgi:hypothetical protein